MKRKIMAFIMAIAIMVPITVNASAAAGPQDAMPAREVTTTSSDTPILRAPEAPKEYMNLDTSSYTAKLRKLAATKGSYSLYYFSTSNGTIAFNGSVQAVGVTDPNSRSFTLTLYEFNTGTFVDSVDFSFTKEAEFKHAFNGLSKNKTYYFKFVNTSNTSSSGSRDISADIVVSNQK